MSTYGLFGTNDCVERKGTFLIVFVPFVVHERALRVP